MTKAPTWLSKSLNTRQVVRIQPFHLLGWQSLPRDGLLVRLQVGRRCPPILRLAEDADNTIARASHDIAVGHRCDDPYRDCGVSEDLRAFAV